VFAAKAGPPLASPLTVDQTPMESELPFGLYTAGVVVQFVEWISAPVALPRLVSRLPSVKSPAAPPPELLSFHAKP
jgi:hypothetical protein